MSTIRYKTGKKSALYGTAVDSSQRFISKKLLKSRDKKL